MNQLYRASPLRRWCLTLFLLVFFSPLLVTGLHNDDLILSVVNFRTSDSPPVIFASIQKSVGEWIGIGRFFPLSTALSVSMFHWFDFTNPLGYHVLQVLLIGWSVYIFVTRFIPDQAAGPAAVLLVCSMSAIYGHYHDPYVSYHVVMPVFTILFFGSVALFEQHLESGRAAVGLMALVLYLLALSTYEIAYPLILVFVVQVLARRPKCVRTWTAIGILVVLMVAFQGWLRAQASTIAYEGVAMKFAPWDVLRTFAIQTFSSFPLAVQIGGVIRMILERFPGGMVEMVLVAGMILLLATLGLHATIRFLRDRSAANSALVIGWIVWLAPALLIAISSKYQTELRWGFGYLPRYLGNFGLTLVLLGLFGRFLATRRGLISAASLALVVFAFNIRYFGKLNRDFAASNLLCNVVGDRNFLRDQGCKNLFVLWHTLNSGEDFKNLNPGVDVRSGGMPADGEHVLLISPNQSGSEWAILGIYQGGLVHNIRLVVGRNLDISKFPGEVTRFREWTIAPVGKNESDYESLRDLVLSGTLPIL